MTAGLEDSRLNGRSVSSGGIVEIPQIGPKVSGFARNQKNSLATRQSLFCRTPTEHSSTAQRVDLLKNQTTTNKQKIARDAAKKTKTTTKNKLVHNCLKPAIALIIKKKKKIYIVFIKLIDCCVCCCCCFLMFVFVCY